MTNYRPTPHLSHLPALCSGSSFKHPPAHCYAAFESETGMTYCVESITRNGGWQVNIARDTCGMTIGENGLNRPQLTRVMTLLKRLGQDRLTDLTAQLEAEAALLDAPTSVRARLKAVAEDATVVSQVDGLLVNGELFTIDELAAHMVDDAAPSGYCSLSFGPAIGRWAMVRYDDANEGAIKFELSAPLIGGDRWDLPGQLTLVGAYAELWAEISA